MKTKFIVLLTALLVCRFVIAQVPEQSFVRYQDTIIGFSINIPSHWKYGLNKAMPKLALVAMHVPLTPGETVRDNFNINVVSTPGKNLTQTFAAFTKALQGAEDYQVVAMGDTIMNGAEFKWIIETHTNKVSRKNMLNYDFITIKDDETYILTLVTFKEAFSEVKALFTQIARSFRVGR